VLGDTTNNVYKWLLNKSQNGVMNTVVKTDFQKYLLNKNGALVGVFDSSTHVNGTVIAEAISDN
jgi:glutathione peroxidase